MFIQIALNAITDNIKILYRRNDASEDIDVIKTSVS